MQKNTKNKRWFQTLTAASATWAVLHLVLFARGARAEDFTYTYTGNNFTIVSGSYTTSDQITGTITLAAALVI